MREGERTRAFMSRLGLQVVGRVVAVVLTARELARRPVARVVALLGRWRWALELSSARLAQQHRGSYALAPILVERGEPEEKQKKNWK